jgi:dTDP-4-amino-4,6-dideoxygalactose transaminase
MKERLEDLAIFGGQKSFDSPLFVGRPNVGSNEKYLQYIKEMLDRKYFTNDGPFVKEFEKRVAAYLGVKECILVCNATVALELASRALGFEGEVIIPAFTFIATAHCLQWQGITPVFCDIDSITHQIDPMKISRLITPKTTGILPVNLWGGVCNIEDINEIATNYGLKVLFDSSHAFGCSLDDIMVGNFGNVEVFSFHATKFLNSLEGGAITTNDEVLAEKIRFMRNFGFNGQDNVSYVGTNGKMNEASAAMGLVNLDYIDQFIEKNKSNHQLYSSRLVPLGIPVYQYNQMNKCNFQYIVTEVDEEITDISRDLLVNILTAENIFARRYFSPGVHRQEPYKSYFPHVPMLVPMTEKICKQVMVLPTGTQVEIEDINNVCDVIEFVIRNAGEINKRLSSR